MVKNENILPTLLSKIIKIEDKENNEVKFKTIEYKIKQRKYSSTKSIIILIDGKELKSSYFRSLYVTYKCRCGRNVKILFMKYVVKPKYWCQHCSQDTSFEDHFKANDIKRKKKIFIKRKIKDFEDLSDEEKAKYWVHHLTNNEFMSWLPYIVKINNKDIDKEKIIYKDVVKNYNNQSIYTSKVSIDNGNKFEGLRSISLKCSCCGKIFNKHPHNLKNISFNKIECSYCNFSNSTYRIRKYKNTSITYQSNLEKYFLDKCFENNIKIMNGYEIPYIFNNKQKTYISDFFLPEYKIVLEIKGSNRFYKNDLKSGKLQAKNDAAIQFCNDNNLRYRFVLDEYVDNFILELLNERDSQSTSNVVGIG